MEMLLKSLARNETLIKDIIENEYDSINKETVGKYLKILDKLHLIQNQPAFNPNIRSRENVGKSIKRHLRNNVTGLEIDAIVLNEDGEYGAIEIKLGANQIDADKENLLKFYEKVDKKPKFMCIICLWQYV